MNSVKESFKSLMSKVKHMDSRKNVIKNGASKFQISNE